MAAKLYFSPFIPTFTSNGLPSPGASLTFYYTGGTTKAPIYSDSGLTTPMTNPVVADSAGKYANIYLNDAITYAVKTLDKNGAQLGDTIDPYIPTSVASLVATVASAAAAAASAAAASTSAGAAATSAATAAAFTGAKSATTTALISAVRTNGFFPQPVTRIAANDVATIAVGTAYAASTINGSSYGQANVLVTNPAKIAWLGGAGDFDVPNAVYQSRGAWYSSSRTWDYVAFETQHTGTTFETQVVASTLNSGPNFRVMVGDKIAGTGTVPTDGNWYYVKVTFPVSATRRVRIEMTGGKTKGLNVASTSECTASGRTYPLVTLIGDSFPEGTGAAQKWDGEGVSLLRSLGFNPANAGVGATGLLNPGSGGRVNWQDANRLADLALNGWSDPITGAASNPLMGVVMMSINDALQPQGNFGGAASYQAAVNKALWVLIDHWNTQRPGKPLVVFGPTASDGAPLLDLYRIRDAGQEACHGASGSNVWFLDRFGPTTLSRSGANTFVSTTGNTTNGSASITGIAASTATWALSGGIEGSGIPAGARILSIDTASSVTLDLPATATATGAALLVRNTQASLYGFNASDYTHPGQPGHNLDTLLTARQLRELILTQFA